MKTLTIKTGNESTRYTDAELRKMARDITKKYGKIKTWGITVHEVNGRTYLDAVAQRPDGTLTICGIAL